MLLLKKKKERNVFAQKFFPTMSQTSAKPLQVATTATHFKSTHVHELAKPKV